MQSGQNLVRNGKIQCPNRDLDFRQDSNMITESR
jgi:hypothetical protein